MAKVRSLISRIWRKPRVTDHETLVVEAMEARVLFSADLLPNDQESGQNTVYLQSESLSDSARHLSTSESNTGEHSRRRELIIVDAALEDAQTLVDDIVSTLDGERDVGILLLESDEDGIAQISDFLSSGVTYDAIHLLSHGSAGQITLGGVRLDANSVTDRADELSGWSNALSPDADLLLYGCDLGATAEGIELVGEIAKLTGADVAASDDLTGAQSLGGDWELEVTTGTIETAIALSESIQKDFATVLATFVVDNTGDFGVGSLRDAITNANLTPGVDLIQFAIPDPLIGGAHTISLNSALPDIMETVFIDGTSEPDYAGTPVIVLRAGGGAPSDGIVITADADNSEIRGLVIRTLATPVS